MLPVMYVPSQSQLWDFTESRHEERGHPPCPTRRLLSEEGATGA